MNVRIKKSGLALGMLTALSFASPASALTVGGVTWNPANFLDLTMQNTVYENDVNAVGDVLNYYGSVSAINGNTNFVSAGAELTFAGSATVGNVGDFDGNGTIDIVFTSATMNFYFDSTADFDGGDPTTWNANSTNSDFATPWLMLAGHTTTRDLDGTVDGLGTLLAGDFFSSLTGGLNFGDLGDAGDGNGSWDVIGGLTQFNFDTDTVLSAGGQALLNPADLTFTSEFQPILDDNDEPTGFLAGNLTLRGESQIPEPATTALLGLGLLGMSRIRSRKI